MDLDANTAKFTFQPERMTQFWQHNAVRLMQANQRILHGLMNAATREMELAQDLTRYNLSKLRGLSGSAAPTAMNPAEGQAEFENIVAGLREVSQELWKTFGDASKMLMEGSAAEAKEKFAGPMEQAFESAQHSVVQSFDQAVDEAGATMERVPGP